MEVALLFRSYRHEGDLVQVAGNVRLSVPAIENHRVVEFDLFIGETSHAHVIMIGQKRKVQVLIDDVIKSPEPETQSPSHLSETSLDVTA